MPYNSIENKITNKIKKCGRGNFFFASDFVQYFIFYRYCKLTLLIYKKNRTTRKKSLLHTKQYAGKCAGFSQNYWISHAKNIHSKRDLMLLMPKQLG